MKNLNIGLFSFILLFALSFLACEPRATDRIEESTEDFENSFQNQRKELKRDMTEAGEKLDKKISNLRKDLSEATSETKAEINKQINELEADKRDLGAELNKMGDQVEDSWQNFRDGVRKRLDNINKKID